MSLRILNYARAHLHLHLHVQLAGLKQMLRTHSDVCFACAGCDSDEITPTQGDVRLVSLSGAATETATCDDVHFGGVEFFNDGEWGRICAGLNDGFEAFTVDATVVCRQLGFRFGSLYDVTGSAEFGSFTGSDYASGDPDRPSEIVWATDVVCTGFEQRLDECFFPQQFGARPGASGGEFSPPGPGRPGLGGTRCDRRDGSVFGVICRQFPLPGADCQVAKAPMHVQPVPAMVQTVVCLRIIGEACMSDLHSGYQTYHRMTYFRAPLASWACRCHAQTFLQSFGCPAQHKRPLLV